MPELTEREKLVILSALRAVCPTGIGSEPWRAYLKLSNAWGTVKQEGMLPPLEPLHDDSELTMQFIRTAARELREHEQE